MDKKLLIAPNSYKEVASSVKAAELFKKYLSAYFTEIISAPLSDGGDGFLDVCINKFSLKKLKYNTDSPAGIPIEVPVCYDSDKKVVYIESSDIVGLKLIPAYKRTPMKFTSRGLGAIIKKINTSLSVNKFVIGIGGTATNDLGLGMLSTLGLKLFNQAGEIVGPYPYKFNEIVDFRWEPEISVPVEIITDVDNPILGEKGSAAVYGPQKGFTEYEIKFLDDETGRLLKLFKGENYYAENLPGAGGGLAAGIRIFMDAEIKTADNFILDDLGLKGLLESSDTVITGEGSFDEQSFYGKGASIVIKNFKGQIFLVCGKIDNNIKLPGNVFPIELTKYFRDPEESKRNFKRGIKSASKEIISYIDNS